jgi:hypothetical protein
MRGSLPLRKNQERPNKLTYHLKSYVAERRNGHWYISPSWAEHSGEVSKWQGPFDSIEMAASCIARLTAIEIANKHSAHVDWYELTEGDELHGLNGTSRLKAHKAQSSNSKGRRRANPTEST